MKRVLVTVVTALAFCFSSALAQEVSAGMTGRVTDPSSAAIVSATVVAKDLERGVEWPTTTNVDGIYVFPRIPAGLYELRVEMAGFKTFRQDGIKLEVNDRARIDVAMQVGNVSDSVLVKADAVVLQTETTQVGAVISPQTITSTPLISRNPVALTLLVTGVVTPNPNGFNTGVRTSGGGRPYVNGNREEANNFLLDGVDNNQISENQTSYQPNTDAIQEFKLITNNAPAEFGNFQGGIINVLIKSGTNEYHGNVFEFFRNDVFNANNWGRNWAGNPRPPLRWNQFGGTFGGPIKKDKLFFFTDYQGLRKANPGAPTSITVFPTAFRNGDFSAVSQQLYNPFSLDASGNRAPFPGNQIPVSMFSPVVKNLFANTKLYPQPLTSGLRNNYINANSSYVSTDQGDIKLDWKITAKDDFSVRYSKGRQDQPGVNTFLLFYNSFNQSPFQNGVLNWTHTFGPSVVNEARAGVNNNLQNNGGADNGIGNVGQQLGIQGAGVGLLSLQGFTYASNIGNANIGTQQLFATTSYHYADNLTIIRGRHLMKMGGQLIRQQINAFYAGNNGRTGFINFGGEFTQGPNAKAPTSRALPEADFVLGLPDDLGRGISTGTWGQRKTIYGVYFQDDWRINETLTLNLGLRWEYHTPLVEVADRMSNFSPFTGTLELAGKNGNSRALYNGYPKDFQPRVGFAWTPELFNRKWVIRGAYTISSFMEGTGTNLRLPLNPPFASEFETRYNTGQTLPGSTLDQGLSGVNPKDPFVGANIRLWDPNIRPADTQQWNFTVEREFWGTVLTAGYVGQHGTHLIVPMPYLQRQLLPNGTTIPSPYLSGNPTLQSEIAQISGTEAAGNQKYNSLQIAARKRYTAGLEFLLSYTWSHGMSDSIGYYGEGGQAGSQSAYMQNLYNRHAEWGPTYFDARHNLVFSYSYELPFGKGRNFGSNWNPVVNGILGGWQMGGIFSAHTGFPLTIKANDKSGTNARSARATVIGTAHNSQIVGPGNHWLDVSAYQQPAVGTFGTAGTGTERGPGLARFDLSLGKRFNIAERRYLELRGEAFNLTNRPLFNSPVSQNVNSALFGEISSTQGERNLQIALKFYF